MFRQARGHRVDVAHEQRGVKVGVGDRGEQREQSGGSLGPHLGGRLDELRHGRV